MKRSISPLAFLGKIEGLPVAAVLAVLYGVFIITAPMVFSINRLSFGSAKLTRRKLNSRVSRK